jgi:hypothetical protein
VRGPLRSRTARRPIAASPYLFFEELPVDNFGNRIPQIQVLAVSAAAPAYPYEQVTTGSSVGTNGHYAAGGDWIIHYSGSGRPIEWFDAATRKFMGTSDWTGLDGNVTNIDLAADGTAYFLDQHDVGGNSFTALYTVPPMGTVSGFDTGAPWLVGPTRVFGLQDEQYIFGGVPTDHAGWLEGGFLQPHAQCGRDAALHGEGAVWGLFEPLGSSNQVTLKQLTGGSGSFTFSAPVTRSNPDSGATFCHVPDQHHWFVVTDGKWITVDDTTGAVKASGAFTGGTNNLPRKAPGATSFWSSYSEISLTDGSTIDSVDPSLWLVENTNGEDFHDRVNDAMWVHPQFTTHQTIRFLKRAGNAGTTLGAIVSRMCDDASLTARNTAALTQVVAGYSWTRGDVKSQMEPILDIHDVDARPHDFEIEFLPRGSAPSGTIITANFVKSDNGPRYKVTIGQDTDLPKVLRVNFADTAFDQQTNNVLSPLPVDSVDSQRDEAIDMTTYADTPTARSRRPIATCGGRGTAASGSRMRSRHRSWRSSRAT